jgi:hypothetical protein
VKRWRELFTRPTLDAVDGVITPPIDCGEFQDLSITIRNAGANPVTAMVLQYGASHNGTVLQAPRILPVDGIFVMTDNLTPLAGESGLITVFKPLPRWLQLYASSALGTSLEVRIIFEYI